MAKTVALVLGSGGARGYAHIGVIEELLARGYEVKAIAGSSMGALVGGVFAAGKLPEYREWVKGLNYLDMVRLLDITLHRPGVISGGRLFEILGDMIGSVAIEDLPVSYTAVATDIGARKEIWFQNGDLMQAIRASIAIPSLFTPVEYQGLTLVDGGILNPLPIAPTVSTHADLIIAVDLNADSSPISVARVSPEEHMQEQRILERFLNKLNWRSKRYVSGEGQDEATIRTGVLDLLNQSLEIMQETLARYKMAGYAPDVLIPIARSQCRFYEFSRAEELIEIGRMMTAQTLDALPASTLLPDGQSTESDNSGANQPDVNGSDQDEAESGCLK